LALQDLFAQRFLLESAMMDVWETVLDHSKTFIAQHGPFEGVKKLDLVLHRQIMNNASHFMSAKACNWGEEEVIKYGRALWYNINEASELMTFHAEARSNYFINALTVPDDHPGPPPHKGSNTWRHWYRLYLKSSSWAQKRSLVMKRCDALCEGCRSAPATQVHHKTYDHVGYEFLFELIGICRDCHARFHGK
jgi:hypothetical protein